MPSLNQDFVRLEHDSFVLEYTSTDSILNSSLLSTPNYAAWWGLSDNDTPVVTNNLLLSSWSNHLNPNAINQYSVSTTFPGCSQTPLAGALNPSAAPTGLTVEVLETKVIVALPYSYFKDVPTGNYYHELVLMKVALEGSNPALVTAYQCRSHVAATGILTVNESLFTNNPYR